jgi:biotin carboxyl carrier protein
MSRTYRDSDREIRVTAVRKDPVDLRRLSRAVIAFAQAQAEAEAQAANPKPKSANSGTKTTVTGIIASKITGKITSLVVDDDNVHDGDAA